MYIQKWICDRCGAICEEFGFLSAYENDTKPSTPLNWSLEDDGHVFCKDCKEGYSKVIKDYCKYNYRPIRMGTGAIADTPRDVYLSMLRKQVEQQMELTDVEGI